MLPKLLPTKQDDSHLSGFKRPNFLDVFVVVEGHEGSGYDIFRGVKTGGLFSIGEYNT